MRHSGAAPCRLFSLDTYSTPEYFTKSLLTVHHPDGDVTARGAEQAVSPSGPFAGRTASAASSALPTGSLFAARANESARLQADRDFPRGLSLTAKSLRLANRARILGDEDADGRGGLGLAREQHLRDASARVVRGTSADTVAVARGVCTGSVCCSAPPHEAYLRRGATVWNVPTRPAGSQC